MALVPSHYREHAPHPALRDVVSCYWSHRSHGRAARILPDACIDLLCRRPLAADLTPLGAWTVQLVGTMTRAALTTTLHEEYLGVRFRPGEAARLLGLGARELTDRTVDLALAWPRPLTLDLEHTLERADCFTDLRAALDALLLARLDRAAPPDRRVRRVLAAFPRGSARVDELARRESLGERQLLRLFEPHVRARPQLISRVLRLQRALARAALADWPRIALAAGYADQAHLIRDCRALTGLSPEKLLRERAMSDPFNPDERDAPTLPP